MSKIILLNTIFEKKSKKSPVKNAYFLMDDALNILSSKHL